MAERDDMPAGRRDRRIVIQRSTPSTDEFNEPVPGWATLATVWAEKRDVSDRERLAASELAADITTRFRILWSDTVEDVNPKDRITYDGKTYDIVGTKEVGRRRGIEITAAARTDS